MTLARVKDITQKCYEGGQHWESSWRKVPAYGSAAGTWCDLSMMPGNPKPNFYIGTELTSTVLDGVNGMYHGGNVAPRTKHLHKMIIGMATLGGTSTANTFLLCDYLMFYPFIDGDSTDEQTLIQAATLPRYADGVGVQAFLVPTTSYLGLARFSISYTNHEGVSGRMSVLESSNGTAVVGNILNSGTAALSGGAFIRLAHGDLGIRSVESITFQSPNGGLAALVLVKPIAVLMTNEATAYAEWDFLTMKPTLPRILDGAYLNLLVCSNSSYSGVLINGTMTVIWN